VPKYIISLDTQLTVDLLVKEAPILAMIRNWDNSSYHIKKIDISGIRTSLKGLDLVDPLGEVWSVTDLTHP